MEGSCKGKKTARKTNTEGRLKIARDVFFGEEHKFKTSFREGVVLDEQGEAQKARVQEALHFLQQDVDSLEKKALLFETQVEGE